MKKLIFLLLSFIFLSGPVYAEQMTLGEATITYTVPEGYFKAQGQPYTEMRKVLLRVSPREMQIFGLYISKDSDAKLQDGTADGVENYFVLASIRQLKDKVLSVREFTEAKKQLIKIQEQGQAKLRAQANRLVGKGTGGALEISDVKALGPYDATDTAISFLSIVDQISRTGTQRTVSHQAAVSTYLLAQGKVVIINQYRQLDPAQNTEEQLENFKTQARQVVKELHIEQGTPKSSLNPFLIKALGGAVVGAILGAVFMLIRKRKKAA